jgi:hypothetical protein
LESHREYNIETHLLFIDYLKAFDLVSQKVLWEIMAENGFPIHLTRTTQSMCPDTAIIISINGNIPVETNEEVIEGCPLLHALFNIYNDRVIKDWQQVIKQNILVKHVILNTISFSDLEVILTSIQDELQRAAYTLNNIATTYSYTLKISVNKAKGMAIAVKEKINVRTDIMINNKIIAQIIVIIT